MVRHWTLTPAFTGSSPVSPAKHHEITRGVFSSIGKVCHTQDKCGRIIMIYTEEIRVRYSEVGEDGILTPVAIVNYLQDITMIHSQTLAGEYKILEAEDECWVLSGWQIDILKDVESFEKIRICTSPYDFKGPMGLRNCWLEDLDGEKLVVANSFWTYIDIKKMMPKKVTKEMEYEPRKIKNPEMVEKRPPIEVKYSQIDTNHHVNNCQYVATALEVLDLREKICRIRTEYKKSAVYNDIVYTKIATEENRTVVTLCDAEDNTYAVVELIGEI